MFLTAFTTSNSKGPVLQYLSLFSGRNSGKCAFFISGPWPAHRAKGSLTKTPTSPKLAVCLHPQDSKHSRKQSIAPGKTQRNATIGYEQFGEMSESSGTRKRGSGETIRHRNKLCHGRPQMMHKKATDRLKNPAKDWRKSWGSNASAESLRPVGQHLLSKASSTWTRATMCRHGQRCVDTRNDVTHLCSRVGFGPRSVVCQKHQTHGWNTIQATPQQTLDPANTNSSCTQRRAAHGHTQQCAWLHSAGKDSGACANVVRIRMQLRLT